MRRGKQAIAALLTATLLLTGQGFSFYEASAAVISAKVGSVYAVVPTILPAHANPVGFSQQGSNFSLNAALTPLSVNAPHVIAAGALSATAAPFIGSQASLLFPSVVPIALTPAAALPAAAVQNPLSPAAQAADVAVQAAQFSQGLTAAKENGRSQAPTLNAFFDGQKAAKDETAAVPAAGRWNLSRLLPGRWFSAQNESAPPKPAASFDPKTKMVFLVREGQPTLSAPLSELKALLAKNPDALAAMNGKGRVVMVTDKDNPQGGLSKADLPQLKTALAESGVTSQVQEDRVSVDWQKQSPAPETGAPEAQKPAVRKGWLGRPFRELAYLGRTVKASYSTPLWSEVIGGVVTKGFPLVVSVATYWKVIGVGHPYLLGIAIAASLFLEVFHGIFLNTWNTFQNNIKKQRGLSYQLFFTLVYMQGWGALFRGLSWGANNSKSPISPPWSLAYWKDILIMSVLGTFFGTLGINGLNGLYAKGRINRWQRSAIQQVRDLLFLLAGPLFASGSMTLFWSVFLFQQLLDLAVFFAGWKAKARPMLYVADASVAESAEFKAGYPVAGLPQGNPLKEAWEGIKGNPIVKVAALPVTLLIKLYKKLRGEKR